LYTVCYVTFSWLYSVPPFAIQQGFYLATAFMVASTLRNATVRDWRILRWAGPLAVVLFLVVFSIDARKAGLDAIATYRDAVASGNVSVIQFVLFQRVFGASVAEALASSPAHRHEVFAGMLVAIYCSVYACTIVRRKGAVFTAAHRGSIVLAVVLVALSLSRSLQLAAALGLLLPVFRIVVVSKARTTTLAVLLVATAALTMVATSPIAGFVWERVTADTGSYSERGLAAGMAIEAISASPIIGGSLPEVSAHNFVLDATVIGGVLTGVLALAFVVLLLRDWFRGLGLYLADATLFAPLAGAAVALVFMFTVGTGTLNLPECMGLALFYGALTAERRPLGEDPGEPSVSHNVSSDRWSSLDGASGYRTGHERSESVPRWL
ncbi:MAG: hypothetical protein LC799_07860, partial [Actinobacteria bacterium]|nr:hypothetical protein [Actinomycetota bacterium]